MAITKSVQDNEVLKFKESSSVAGQPGVVVVNPDGSTISGGAGGGGDGAIVDGVSASIKATVKNLVNSKPLTTALVDANGDQITSFGGGTQYAEDAAHASGNIGTMALGVRNDTASALAGTDGDYIPLTTNNLGQLHAVQSGRTATGTITAATQSVSVDTTGASVVGYQIVGTGVGGAQLHFEATVDGTNYFTIRFFYHPANTALNPVETDTSTGASLKGYVLISGYKSVRVYYDTLAAGSVAVTLYATNANARNVVNIVGTVSTYLKNQGGNYLDLNDGIDEYFIPVGAEIRHDAADLSASGPVKIGGYAKTTAPTAVSADGDRVNAWFDLNGRLQVGDGAGSLTIDNSSISNLETYIQKNLVNLNGLVTKSSQFAILKKDVLSSPQTTSGNPTITFDGSETLYIYKPAATNSSLFSYNIRTDTLTTLSTGLTEAYTGAGIIYANGKLYYTRGGAYQTFSRINTDGTGNTALTNCSLAVNFAAPMVYDGSNLIYLRTNAGFAKYSISGDSWTTLTAPTGAATEGAALALVGKDRIYSLRGAGTTTLQMYKINNTFGNADADTWTSKTAIPTNVYDGGALAWNGDNYIYALSGNGAQYFYRYDIGSNAWQVLPNLPVPNSTGSNIMATNNGFLCYVVEPSNLNTTGFGTVNNLYYYDPTRDLATIGAGRYNSSQPTLTNGQTGELQLSADASLSVAPDSTTEGVADGVNNTIRVYKDVFGFTPNQKVFPWMYNGTTWDRVRGDTTNGLDVDVTRVSGTVTVDSELPAAAVLADATANPTVPGVAAYGMNFNGSTLDRTRGDTFGTWVQGPRAHDGAYNTTGPVLIGAYASTSAPTAVSADGNAVRLWSDRNGRLQIGDGGGSITVDGAVTATPEKASSATLSNVSGSATSVTLKASNSSRKKLTIFNDSSANLYVKYGATASTTSFSYKLAPSDTLEEITYTGIVDGIWDSATGAARVTEL